MSTPSPRHLIRNAIWEMTRQPEDAGRPVLRYLAAGGEPDPLAVITAAASLSREAARATRDHARRAREAGKSWDQIGEALGPQGDGGLASHAFYLLASDLGRGPSFAWTCGACGQTVIDYGPEAGSPEDQESGHGEGCTRLAAAIVAWDAQWEDDEE
jgi:hypothetical protein